VHRACDNSFLSLTITILGYRYYSSDKINRNKMIIEIFPT